MPIIIDLDKLKQESPNPKECEKINSISDLRNYYPIDIHKMTLKQAKDHPAFQSAVMDIFEKRKGELIAIQNSVQLLAKNIHDFENAFSLYHNLANSQITEIIKSLRAPYESIVGDINHIRSIWNEATRTASLEANVIEQIKARFNNDFLTITEAASRVQEMIDLYKTPIMNTSWAVKIQIEEPLLSLVKMMSSYRDMWTALEREPRASLCVTPNLLKLSGMEMYLATRHFEVIRNKDVSPDDSDISKEVQHGLDSLAELVIEVDSRFLKLLSGAREAVHSRNPDRIRHAIVSYRELFTQLLHKLAPDGEFQRWNKDPANLDEKGRPTRKGRMRYLCRDINCGEFKAYVEADINVTNTFLAIYSRITHEPECSFSEQQVKAAICKMENLLIYILSISRDS